MIKSFSLGNQGGNQGGDFGSGDIQTTQVTIPNDVSASFCVCVFRLLSLSPKPSHLTFVDLPEIFSSHKNLEGKSL